MNMLLLRSVVIPAPSSLMPINALVALIFSKLLIADFSLAIRPRS